MQFLTSIFPELKGLGIVIYTLGLPGLILMLWWVDMRRFATWQSEHSKSTALMLEELRNNQVRHQQKHEARLSETRESIATIFKKHESNMERLERFYENNVELVRNYRKLSQDLSQIIHLNTQTQTQLVEQVRTMLTTIKCDR